MINWLFENVNKEDRHLTGSTLRHFCLYLSTLWSFSELLLLWQLSHGFCLLRCELLIDSFSRLHSSFCDKSTEKMKHICGPKALWVFVPKIENAFKRGSCYISRGIKKQSLVYHFLHSATESQQWWHSPRSVSGFCVLTVTKMRNHCMLHI